jgi:hypothetical protein
MNQGVLKESPCQKSWGGKNNWAQKGIGRRGLGRSNWYNNFRSQQRNALL